MEVRQLPDKFREGFKYTYKDVKKCSFKKELGEDTQECKKMWEDLGIKEV